MNEQDLASRLTRRIGLAPESLGASVLRSAVARRMVRLGKLELSDYIALFDRDQAEFQALVEELVVGESWFFRHAHAFRILQRHASETISGGTSLYRVLSLPCAAGEEPYSIAIALAEAGLRPDQFQVDAWDISQRALDRARRGWYGARAIRATPGHLRERYFRPIDGGVEVVPEVRGRVHFWQANVLQGECWSLAAVYDAIFFRNLMIYLTDDARASVLEKVNSHLSQAGILFVGHAEQIKELDSRFALVGERAAFAYGRRIATVPRPIPQGSSLARTAAVEMEPALGNAAASQVAPAIRGKPLGPEIPSPRKLTSEPRSPSTPATLPTRQTATGLPFPSGQVESKMGELSLLQQAAGLANEARYADSIALCEQHLQRFGPTSSAYHMLGMIQQAAGLYDRAAQALERAVYLDRDHEESLLALALLARRRGDIAVADRFQERARRAHERRKAT